MLYTPKGCTGQRDGPITVALTYYWDLCQVNLSWQNWVNSRSGWTSQIVVSCYRITVSAQPCNCLYV